MVELSPRSTVKEMFLLCFWQICRISLFKNRFKIFYRDMQTKSEVFKIIFKISRLLLYLTSVSSFILDSNCLCCGGLVYPSVKCVCWQLFSIKFPHGNFIECPQGRGFLKHLVAGLGLSHCSALTTCNKLLFAARAEGTPPDHLNFAGEIFFPVLAFKNENTLQLLLSWLLTMSRVFILITNMQYFSSLSCFITFSSLVLKMILEK